MEAFARCKPINGKVNIAQLIEATRDFKQDIAHLPLLYLLDSDKDGQFTLADVFNFVQFQLQLDERDPLRALKANATLRLNADQGSFVKWFADAVGAIAGVTSINGVQCVDAQVVILVHELLNIGITKVSGLEFVETLQTAGEQIGLPRNEGFVSLLILQTLAMHIVNGIRELYKEIVEGVLPVELQSTFKTTDLQEEYDQVAKTALTEDSDNV